MSTENTIEKTPRRRSRHGFWFGIVVGGLSGAIVAGAVVAAASVSAAPSFAARAFGHGHGGHGFDPETARERAELAASFVLGRVDASEAQKAEARRIVSDAVSEILPLAAEHRGHREALHDAFSQTEIDAESIEAIRRAEMALADQASRTLTVALTSLAQTLTYEQRAELMELAHRLHR